VDIIHKSLHTMFKQQTDWTKHLQAVAMTYRASATTNLHLSPHHVVFRRNMEMAIDESMTPEKTTNSAEAYYGEIRPKLATLYQIAQQNAA
jgi:hypothetical protein